MTDLAKKIKNTSQDTEAKAKTEEDHAKGKPSSENLNKAKVKTRDALTWNRDGKSYQLFSCNNECMSWLLILIDDCMHGLEEESVHRFESSLA